MNEKPSRHSELAQAFAETAEKFGATSDEIVNALGIVTTGVFVTGQTWPGVDRLNAFDRWSAQIRLFISTPEALS